MKTFKFTVPEPKMSSVEKKYAELYTDIKKRDFDPSYLSRYQYIFFKPRNQLERYALYAANQTLIHRKMYRYMFIPLGIAFFVLGVFSKFEDSTWILGLTYIVVGIHCLLIQSLAKIMSEMERDNKSVECNSENPAAVAPSAGQKDVPSS